MNPLKPFLPLFTLLLVTCALTAQAQDFDIYFEDNTLRLDYLFAGDVHQQHIYLEQMYKQDRWAGRKSRLAEKFLNGNGQLTVRDHDTHTVLFVHTFSTLFQEWLLYDEAKRVQRAFETSYNIPFPRRTVDIEVTLTDNRHHVVASMRHTVDPHDILIRHLTANDTPYHYLWKGGADTHVEADITGCIDLAIVAEGYTQAEMGKFYFDAQRAVDALFAWEPFASLKDRFNVVAVAAPSLQSGTSIPHDTQWLNTTASSHYDTFYMDRYLTSQEMHHIYDLLSGVPFEHIILLINSSKYGGGGIFNQITCATADHATFKEVLVHEFGHAYGGLADEYAYDDMDSEWYPADTEPWEPNITTLKDFDSKWKDMLSPDTPIPTPLDPTVPNVKTMDKDDAQALEALNQCTQRVGVFEGAGYVSQGCYRPAQECRMKVNQVRDFCPVCTRAIRRITDFYTAK